MRTEPLLDRGHPDHAPADVGGGHAAWRARVPAGGGEVRIPGLESHVIGEHDELVVDLLPVAGAADRWAATACTIDVTLTDGTRIGADARARDEHGTLLDPLAQAVAKRRWVDQWNRTVVDLAPFAGATVAHAALVVAAEEATTIFVDELDIRARADRPEALLDWVDTRRGSRSSDRFSRGNTAPLVGVPHGGVFGVPMTDASSRTWPYRWQRAPRIEAFATSHIPSPWIGDRGVLQLMPSPSHAPKPDRARRSLALERGSERARPDAYEAGLEGVSVLMTAARHAVGMRFHAAGERLSVIVDHLGHAREAAWRLDGDELRLDVTLRDDASPLEHCVHVVARGVARVDVRHRRGTLRGSFRMRGGDADVVVGVSTIDATHARANAEAAGGIDRMRAEAAAAWSDKLARFEVPGDVPDDTMRSIAGSLARVFAYPNAHDEPAATREDPHRPIFRSPVDGALHDGALASNNGFWDTYRTAWPMLGLLTPETAAHLADGFSRHATSSGWVPRWSAPGPVDSMTGTTSDTVFAGLAAQGVPLQLDDAYRSALVHASVPAADARVGRKGLHLARFRGFVDTATHEGLSWTLDGAMCDAGAARLAGMLAERTADPAAREQLDTEREWLSRRALGYRAVFHPRLGMFIGRTPSGAWRVADDDFEPAEWGGDYTETNAWGTAFTAPHDGAGLAALHGGEAALGAALDAFFATPETADPSLVGSYGFVIHEMLEARDVRMGMLGLSNQPAHHIPLTYCFAGRHDDAHRIVVEARDRLFVGSAIGQGYPGDEDNGEMSAWYLFAVLGLYPLVPGSGEMVLTPPLLPRVVLHPEGRESLEITAEGAGLPYVRSVRIDGARWDRIAVPAAVLRHARSIAFELSDEPTGWARDSRPSSWSTEHGVDAPLRDLLTVVPGTVTDDEGRGVRLAPGDSVTCPLEAPSRLSFVVVTLGGEAAPLPLREEPVDAAWRLVGIAASGEEVELDERHERWIARCQSRPFRVRHGHAPLVAVRFEARSPIHLGQLEAFAP